MTANRSVTSSIRIPCFLLGLLLLVFPHHSTSLRQDPLDHEQSFGDIPEKSQSPVGVAVFLYLTDLGFPLLTLEGRCCALPDSGVVGHGPQTAVQRSHCNNTINFVFNTTTSKLGQIGLFPIPLEDFTVPPRFSCYLSTVLVTGQQVFLGFIKAIVYNSFLSL